MAVAAPPSPPTPAGVRHRTAAVAVAVATVVLVGVLALGWWLGRSGADAQVTTGPDAPAAGLLASVDPRVAAAAPRNAGNFRALVQERRIVPGSAGPGCSAPDVSVVTSEVWTRRGANQLDSTRVVRNSNDPTRPVGSGESKIDDRLTTRLPVGTDCDVTPAQFEDLTDPVVRNSFPILDATKFYESSFSLPTPKSDETLATILSGYNRRVLRQQFLECGPAAVQCSRTVAVGDVASTPSEDRTARERELVSDAATGIVLYYAVRTGDRTDYEYRLLDLAPWEGPPPPLPAR